MGEPFLHTLRYWVLVTVGAILLLAVATLLPDPRRADAASGADYPAVFGTVAVRFDSMPAAGPFHDMMARRAEDPGLRACPPGPDGRCAAALWRAWGEARETFARAPQVHVPLAAIILVDRFVNGRLGYAEDRVTWDRDDYWATPVESLERGQGDCEDFAILKMALLEDLGLPVSSMRIAVVRDMPRNRAHAVLTVAVGHDLVVLDNQAAAPLPDRLVTRYRPLYSVSPDGAWIHGIRMGHYF